MLVIENTPHALVLACDAKIHEDEIYLALFESEDEAYEAIDGLTRLFHLINNRKDLLNPILDADNYWDFIQAVGKIGKPYRGFDYPVLNVLMSEEKFPVFQAILNIDADSVFKVIDLRVLSSLPPFRARTEEERTEMLDDESN